MNEAYLEYKVQMEIQKIHWQVNRIRRSNPRVKHLIIDFPAVVVACGSTLNNKVFCGQSSFPQFYKYSNLIRKRLEELGPIGTKRRECDNIIGACAEPHAADKVVKSVYGCGLCDLRFSKAYRPRTGQKVKYCNNCKDTFFEVL